MTQASKASKVAAVEVPTTSQGTASITINPMFRGEITVAIMGESPLIFNVQSEKAKRELLSPSPKKNAAERQSTAKHDPLAEFAASFGRLPEGSPTLLAVPASALKGAMMTAALDLPGTKRAQIGRLVYVKGHQLPVYGVPEVFMTGVRSADMNRTPDIRTRAIVREWVVLVTVSYAIPLLNEKSVVSLLSSGGVTAGIGDFRVEKGKGDFGRFCAVRADDPQLLRIMKAGGRLAQQAAVEKPQAYDEETRSLLEWHAAEQRRRGFKAAA